MFPNLLCPERRCTFITHGTWVTVSPGVPTPTLTILSLPTPAHPEPLPSWTISSTMTYKLPPEYNLPHTYVEMQVRGPGSQAWGPGAELMGMGLPVLFPCKEPWVPSEFRRRRHQESGLAHSWKCNPHPSLHIHL